MKPQGIKIYLAQMQKGFCADRFISARTDDVASKFGTKAELFDGDQSELDPEGRQRQPNHHVNNHLLQETNLLEEENRKMYTALLQNQVLGIDNPFLLHEIHNSDENCMKKGMYTQQLQASNDPRIENTFEQNSEANGGMSMTSVSPFNSKFTVLKLNDQSVPQNANRGLFSNLSNLPQNRWNCYDSGPGDPFSQNMAQYERGNRTFALNPASGFDEDQVIVPKKKQRKIPKIPYKVLDAPALQDDFYLNLVDWSSHNNLAVGLSSCIYIWSATSSKVTKLYDLGPQDSVTSVCWSKRGSHLSIGTNSGVVQVWDINKSKMVRTLRGHEGRVGTIAWSNGVLSSGSRDKNILQRDLREKDEYFAKLSYHKQEVCGLKWSYDEQQLASGGNDNRLYVWNIQNPVEPVGKFTSHLAAVKALTWSPHQHGLLASGGGTADRCIRFWNTLSMQEVSHIETGSQVCNLLFSKNVNEFISTHGYSDNAIVVWKYPSMKKIATLTGHSLRVLYLAMSPDGETIVTGAGDETLRFWKVFPQKKAAEKEVSMIDPNNFNIR